jgi:hypothetical protein
MFFADIPNQGKKIFKKANLRPPAKLQRSGPHHTAKANNLELNFFDFKYLIQKKETANEKE